ncbi:hypothetical protein B0A49_05813, partial [Cryomyces minteri]
MARFTVNAFICSLLTYGFAQAQSSYSGSADGLTTVAASTATGTVATGSGTQTSFRAIFTVPASADQGANLLPTTQDPEAVDPQKVCPGYMASNVVRSEVGFSATLSLAGPACNVYGTDIETLNLTVAYQTAHRLAVNISPANIAASNMTQYILSDELVQQPKQGVVDPAIQDIDLQFSWSNDPTFSFTILRKSNGDVLFDTKGTKLVFENQFIEFVSALPENYNLYGLGERIHGLRLGNNFTATTYAADVGDPIDLGIYGSHPFYLDTRYYEIDSHTGDMTYYSGNNSAANGSYTSMSHGVYLRNAHGQETLLRPDGLTWRTIGGSIDLYFFDGPSQSEVTKQYQFGAVGLPAMQQYFTFGYHQCRWGYKNWTQLQEVVDNFAAANIPLENIWTDIDYMNQYRDFSNDQNTFSFAQGKQFLDRLHANGQHYIPIVDSAIYIPNPNNASDAYATYNRGNSSGVFLTNPDGSQYIGEVWPGYTVFPDWHSGNAVPWWTNEMQTWYQDIAFDGIWIDMSEVSSFCVGSCGTGNVTMNPVHPSFGLPGEPGSIVYDYPEAFNITNATEAASASAGSSS